MQIILKEGEKTEKEATLLPEEAKQERKEELGLLEQINGKLDLLLQATQIKTEE